KALVTGVTGFTGGHLARRLLEHGDTVRVFARDATRVPPDLQGRVDIVTGDITSDDDLRRALAGQDVVYNIAALYREAGLPADRYRAVNARAVAALIEAASVTRERPCVQRRPGGW